ncbi:MAG TPA: hypothetical protein PLH82_02095 [Candidatus Paceibacterota bacterium]|nr:hypothetical protein [Candidatus Paceibacterota bacterium]
MKNQGEFVKIDYSVIPKEVFDLYGAKPFEIAKRKARDEKGNVINNITFSNAKAEAKKRGCRLPTIMEILVLLHTYRERFPESASIYHDDFLGIEELSFNEDVRFEFVDSLADIPFLRGGRWGNASDAGAFALDLHCTTGSTGGSIGFRYAR